MSATDPVPAREERVAAIILAAGSSRRMGENKLLLNFLGASLLLRATNNALGAWLVPVVVVVGFEEERMRRELQRLPVEIVTNPDYGGPSSLSMHAALRALPDDVAGALVILPDMPVVSSEMLRDVKAAAEDAPQSPLVASRYGDVTAPPILFRRALFDELLAWSGEGCGKPVVKEHAYEAVYLDWPPEVLEDVDTPEDFARISARHA